MVEGVVTLVKVGALRFILGVIGSFPGVGETPGGGTLASKKRGLSGVIAGSQKRFHRSVGSTKFLDFICRAGGEKGIDKNILPNQILDDTLLSYFRTEGVSTEILPRFNTSSNQGPNSGEKVSGH